MRGSIDEVVQLIALEARLLDDQDYPRWLDLFTEDCVYWAPVSREQKRPTDGVSHIHDDWQLMRARTHRLANPRAYGAEPGPVTARVVSGIRIDAELPDLIEASCSQIMAEYRARGHFEQDQRIFASRVSYVLARTAQGLRIRLKRIDLINAGGPLNALTALL